MKNLAILLMMIPMALSSAFAATRNIDVSVKGMVCSFCAQGITKKFSSEDSVDKVNVSLENHLVSLQLKDGKDLSDEKIQSVLKDAGYNVDTIKRK